MKRISVLAFSLCLALVAVPGLAQYCPSVSGLTTCPNDEYISNVTIGSLNNNSTCLPAPAYEDYTSLAGPSLTQASGTVINVTVSNWYSVTDTVTAFFDWNGNSVLNDVGEVYGLLQGTAGASTVYTGTITPPVGAVATTRMRVKTVYGASANPCTGSSNWSNTEDYTVHTLPPTGLAAAGSATPSPVTAQSPALFTVAVSATQPPNPPTGVNVFMDLSPIGGNPTQLLYDDGTNGGDVTAGDLTFSWSQSPVGNGNFLLQYLAIDGIGRTATGSITLAVYPYNDACGNSTQVGLGTNGPFTNLYATDSGVTASCSAGYKDVWYHFTPPCTGPYRIDTCSPALFDSVVSVYAACGGAEIACNNDGGVVGCGYTSNIANIALTGGNTVWIRVASWSTTAVGTFNLNINQVFTTTWSSPFGAGSIKFDLTGGPLSGTYYHALALAPGAYPNGWLYGVDITLPEVVSQISFGWPFVGPLDSCGNAFAGPFFPVPTGLTVWAVGLASPGPGLGLPSYQTSPSTYTVP